jgi:hypothetical protein
MSVLHNVLHKRRQRKFACQWPHACACENESLRVVAVLVYQRVCFQQDGRLRGDVDLATQYPGKQCLFIVGYGAGH